MNLTELCKVDIPEGKSEKWYIEKFTVNEKDFGRLYYQLHGGRDVPPGTYTRLMLDHSFNNPMMADTPSEIYDHYEPIYKAKELGGRILINGLGLGCIIKAMLTFPNVTRIDVVELEQGIIDLVAPSYKDDRVYIYHNDAYIIKWDKADRWTVAWHDIWANICSDNLEEMAKLHRKYGHKVTWQGSWAKEQCLRQRGTGY